MMEVLIVYLKNGDVEYYGPFPYCKRADVYAEEYKKLAPCHKEVDRWETHPLITPYSVVKTVIWRRVNNLA